MNLDETDPIKTSRVRRIINQHRSRYQDGIPTTVITAKAETAGIEPEFVEEFLVHETERGRLYSPENGKIDVT